ncbi:ATP-dependent DNA helicase RecG [Actinomycetospora lemnae]|uniref:Probable DNA 3'-5' helicase RecG n=1 Tax=Actinomycetospora lemnae TaxID=3019891 RepID=A0ABT5SNI0_9PSEU|nr:ATP-dependent DNA helicase RecG [Actinomycetospora sp. DW7H6]MDD7964394.1 ATP-dependent DNA helicase RecG [Actinomycetospora sp. DW7H6]
MLVAVVGMDTSLRTALGDKTARPLARQLELETVGDLLRHYPRKYIEHATVTHTSEREDQRFRPGEHVTLLGTVEKVAGRRMRHRKGHIVEATVSVGAQRFTCTFFNQPYRERDLAPGTRALFSGDLSRYRGGWQLAAPEFIVLNAGAEAQLPGLIPIYPATRKLRSWVVMLAVRQVLDLLDEPEDPLPDTLRATHGLASLGDALRRVHLPDTREEEREARRRLVWDEAFGLQLAMAGRRASATTRPAPACPRRDDGLAAAFDARLPFALTGAQRSVGESLSEALAGEEPLNRLLQGDVGSGKTVVALRAMLQVVDAGRQAVLLAPTEVLAAQHARSLQAMLGPLGRAGELSDDPAADPEHATRVTLLTGSLGAKARRQALLDAQSGAAGIVVGTHAVIQQGVGFADLGLVVVDEQHRFGVHQRDELRSRSGPTTPHVLVMTATPIPRTVALTLYGDLDISVLDELPTGRKPIATTAVPAGVKPRWLERAWERVREEVAAGHQAYVVCPRIGDEGGEPGEQWPEPPAGDLLDPEAPGPDEFEEALRKLRPPDEEEQEEAARPPLAVTDVGPMLAEGPLAGLRLEILHGRMPTDEKDAVMRAFSEGRVDVLVATTVIEVGVDVPNATMMIIMDADRFGVSQLHQLRGRVGRGAAASSCLLVTEAAEGSPALQRLERLAATPDGFEVSRIDLEVRDEGDVLGAQQSGRRSGLHMLSVLKHGDLVAEAREEARAVMADDPLLARHPGLAGLVRSVVGEAEAAFLDRL